MQNIDLSTLSSLRLKITKLSRTDFDDLTLMLKDEEVMQATGLRTSQSTMQIEEHFQRWLESKESFNFTIRDVDQAYIGWMMLKKLVIDKYELGYMLPVNSWGQGYATEMVAALLESLKDSNR